MFLGEVAITPYETPGGQKFADTVIPYIKDTDVVLLANHGTITAGTDLMDAYFKTEIIDAYCRILILTKQLGSVNFYSDAKAAELLKLKPSLGIRDVRLEKGLENCDLCGNSMFREGYTQFKPEHHAIIPPKLLGRPDGPGLVSSLLEPHGDPNASHACGCKTEAPAPAQAAPAISANDPAFETLVQRITNQVMLAMNGQAR